MDPVDQQRIVSLLSDPTRHRIYQYVLAHSHQGVSATETAQEFGIHPTVARLHLEKLSEVGLVAWQKGPSTGGRPTKIYLPGAAAVQISFPPRDYYLLARVTTEALIAMGPPGIRQVERSAEEMGREMALLRLARERGTKKPARREQIMRLVEDLNEGGTFCELTSATDREFEFKLTNCPFRELSSNDPHLVCRIHRGVLRGLLDQYLGQSELVEPTVSMAQGADSCEFRVRVT